MSAVISKESPISLIHKQELIDHYEELRTLALAKSKGYKTNNSPGESVILFRGMATWVKTCLSSEFITKPKDLQSDKTRNDDQETPTLPIDTLPHALRKEATMLLTNMILFQQQNSRSYYA
jgi:hypothetical protein